MGEACNWVSAGFAFASLLNSGMHVWTPTVVPLWSPSFSSTVSNVCRTSAYETSALIAAALETATLPYRLTGGMRPSEFMSALTPAHRPVCGLQVALPLPTQLQKLASAETKDGGFQGQPSASLSRAFIDLTA